MIGVDAREFIVFENATRKVPQERKSLGLIVLITSVFKVEFALILDHRFV